MQIAQNAHMNALARERIRDIVILFAVTIPNTLIVKPNVSNQGELHHGVVSKIQDVRKGVIQNAKDFYQVQIRGVFIEFNYLLQKLGNHFGQQSQNQIVFFKEICQKMFWSM